MDSSKDFAGVVSWDDNIDHTQAVTDNFSDVENAINLVDATGSTDLDVGLWESIGLLDNAYQSGLLTPENPGYIIFLTDGAGGYTYGPTGPAAYAAQQGYTIYGIGLGPAQMGPLNDMANATGGMAFTAQTPDDLQPVFDAIQQEVAGPPRLFPEEQSDVEQFDRGDGNFPWIMDSTSAIATSETPITFDGSLVTINNTLNIGVSLNGLEPYIEIVNINVYERNPDAMAQKIEAEIEQALGGQYAQNRERHISVEAVSTGIPNEYYFKLSTDSTGANVRLMIEPESVGNEDVYLFNTTLNVGGQDGNDKLKISVDGEEIIADLNGAKIFHYENLVSELRSAVNNATKHVPNINVFMIDNALNLTSGLKGRESLLEIISGTRTLASDIGFTEGAKDLGRGSTFSFQVGGNEEEFEHTISLLGTEVMGIHDIDVKSEAGAIDAISKVKDAISYVSTVETQVGSAVNGLWNRIGITESHRGNLLSQTTRLKEADFAKEASQFARLRTLLSSASALYAQSNLPIQQILQLLR